MGSPFDMEMNLDQVKARLQSPGIGNVPKPNALTAKAIQDAMDDLYANGQRAAIEAAERTNAFWDTVPERLRDHPFVVLLGQAIGSAVMHPADARAMQDEYDRLLTLDDVALADDKLRAAQQIRTAMGWQ